MAPEANRPPTRRQPPLENRGLKVGVYILFAFLAPTLSGILLFLGFPPFDMPALAWVALVPLFLVVPLLHPAAAAAVGFWCGIVFFLGVFDWGLSVASYTYLHHAILSVCFSLYLPFVGAAIAYVSRKKGVLAAYTAAPFVWVALEFVKSNLPLLAYPWGLLAHTQYQNPAVIQMASVTGTYGISFLLVWANAVASAFLCRLLPRPRRSDPGVPFGPGTRALSWVFAAGMAVSVSITLWFGQAQLSRPVLGETAAIAAVQANIPQDEKWNPRHASHIMKTYVEMTRAAAARHPDLIVWPEAATPGTITRIQDLYTAVTTLAREAKTHLLIGSTSHQKFEGARAKDLRYRNSAFFIPPDSDKGSELPRYDKIRLLAFAEYLPYAGLVPWALIQVPELGSYLPGREKVVFDHPRFRFSVTICWENIFPDLVRQFVKNGAGFIVNITNEAWFGTSAAPRQFLAMSVFRAVENRVFVVRCANTGISSIIDPYGRIVERLTDAEGRELMVRGVLHGTVVPLYRRTLYTRAGDWLAVGCLAATCCILVVLRCRGVRSGPSRKHR